MLHFISGTVSEVTSDGMIVASDRVEGIVDESLCDADVHSVSRNRIGLWPRGGGIAVITFETGPPSDLPGTDGEP